MGWSRLFSYEEIVERALATREARFAGYLRLLPELYGLRSDEVLSAEHLLLGLEMLRQNVVLTVYEDMARAEDVAMQTYFEAGRDPLHALIGIVLDTPVAWIIRHPVKVWDRKKNEWIFRGWEACYWKNGVDGISVNIIAYTEDGKLLLVAAHRGPVVPRWELEFPGGGLKGAKRIEEAVRLQLFEEAGYEPGKIDVLHGDVRFIVDPSVNGTPIHVVAVKLAAKVAGGNRPQMGEVISSRVVLLGKQELLEAYTRGWYPHPLLPGVRCYLPDGRNGHLLVLALMLGLVR